MSSKLFVLALLAVAGLASADYARGTFYFQSGATVIAIGAIMWIPPTNATGDITAEKWIFGNVSYTGTTPDYQAFVFDLDNKTITCELNTGNCFKNETAVKRGWHSIRVYLRNAGGENWSEQRYIYMNVSQSQDQPIYIIGKTAQAKNDLEIWIIGGVGFVFALIVFAIRKRIDSDARAKQDFDDDINSIMAEHEE